MCMSSIHAAKEILDDQKEIEKFMRIVALEDFPLGK